MHRLLKWCLACLVVIIALIGYAIAGATQGDTRRDRFERYQRIINQLFLDPTDPAIGDEDRRRVKEYFGLK